MSLPRRKGLKRTPMKPRTTPLAPMGRVRAQERKVQRRREHGDWKRAVVRGGCVMCRHDPPSSEVERDFHADLKHLEGHHVIPKQHLSDELKFDETVAGCELGDNGVCLCRYHHERHEKYVQRMPRVLVPESTFIFADKLNLGWRLDHEYPEET